MIFNVISLILIIGVIAIFLIGKKYQNETERLFYKDLLYWTVMFVSYVVCIVIYGCVFGGRINIFRAVNVNVVTICGFIVLLAGIFEVCSPSKRIVRIFTKQKPKDEQDTQAEKILAAENCMDNYFKIVSSLLTALMILLPVIHRLSTIISDNESSLNDGFIGLSGICMVVMSAICIRQMLYQIYYSKIKAQDSRNTLEIQRVIKAQEFIKEKNNRL